MTTAHVAALYFDGRREMAKKRLQRIKSVGYVAERPRSPFAAAVLFLPAQGIEVLRSEGILQEYPAFDRAALVKRAQVSDLTIRHELEVMDVKVAFHRAIRVGDRHSIAEFGTWPVLYQFGSRAVTKPDGFMRFRTMSRSGQPSEDAFFLEIDRSTESQEALVSKAASYLDYYKSGGFAERNGAHRLDFRNYPFRVLVVLKNSERRNNLAEWLLRHNPPILAQIFLSTAEEVIADPLGSIWIRPIDYRNAVKGTPFALGRSSAPKNYRRSIARDSHIERTARKIRAIGETPVAALLGSPSQRDREIYICDEWSCAEPEEPHRGVKKEP
jgi:hypothetical protein